MYAVDINPDDPKSIEAALRTEWLLTNGLGGYAMGTLLGVDTRRYHGLFVVATKPPVGRLVVLHSLIDRCTFGEHEFSFATQQFTDDGGQPMLHPGGYRNLVRVTVEPPHRITWTYRAGKAVLRRRLMLEQGRQLARLQYEIENAPPKVRISVRPLMPLRDFHSISCESHAAPILAANQRDEAIVQREGVRARLSGISLLDEPQWWRGLVYELDRERGQEWREDVWSPGAFGGMVPTHVRGSASITIELLDAASPPQPPKSPPASPTTGTPVAVQPAATASRAFVVARESTAGWTTSVIAGYPWFGDWGRDTMIALPGLMLCTGRFDQARSTLECFAKHLRNGLVPNLFDDYGEAAHYNTVDASLWFVHAVHALWNASPSPAERGKRVSEDLRQACREVVAAYRHGTDFKIRMEADGLITAGDESTQLTWMDAKRDGVVFTPRHGKAVEINALWHNALVCLSAMTDDSRERDDLSTLGRRVAASFQAAFWWDERQCLHDCLTPRHGGAASDGPDTSEYQPDGRLIGIEFFWDRVLF
jgi:glycogen debranching enzyme